MSDQTQKQPDRMDRRRFFRAAGGFAGAYGLGDRRRQRHGEDDGNADRPEMVAFKMG